MDCKVGGKQIVVVAAKLLKAMSGSAQHLHGGCEVCQEGLL